MEFHFLDMQAWKATGNECFRRGDFSAAVSAYSSGLDELKGEEMSQADSVATLLCNRSAALFNLGKHALSAKDAQAALKLRPQYVKASNRLGLAQSALNLYQEARLAFEHSLALEPSNHTAKKALKAIKKSLKQSSRAAAEEASPLPFGQAQVVTEMLAKPDRGLMAVSPQAAQAEWEAEAPAVGTGLPLELESN